MCNLKCSLDIITSFITILGVPTGLYIYYSNKKKEREQKELEVYNSLDDKYIDFLKLCAQYPDLKISADNREDSNNLTEAQKYQRLSIYEILISLLERADLLYKSRSTKIKKQQFKGWESYKNDWMKTKSFREAWNTLGSEYEETFVQSMNTLYNQYQQ